MSFIQVFHLSFALKYPILYFFFINKQYLKTEQCSTVNWLIFNLEYLSVTSAVRCQIFFDLFIISFISIRLVQRFCRTVQQHNDTKILKIKKINTVCKINKNVALPLQINVHSTQQYFSLISGTALKSDIPSFPRYKWFLVFSHYITQVYHIKKCLFHR